MSFLSFSSLSLLPSFPILKSFQGFIEPNPNHPLFVNCSFPTILKDGGEHIHLTFTPFQK